MAAYAICVFSFCVFYSCKKEEKRPSDTVVLSYGDDFVKWKKFVSITTEVPISEISFDSQSQEFVLRQSLRLKLDVVRAEYESADEYRFKYELDGK